MALNGSGPISLGGSTAGESINLENGLSATAQVSLNDAAVRSLAGVPSGVIIMPTDFYGKSSSTATQKAIFGFGQIPAGATATTNLISSSGVMAATTPAVGTARVELAAATYGGDKALFGFGGQNAPATGVFSTTNLVSNTGVVSSDTPGVGLSRKQISAAKYGNDKAIFAYGQESGFGSITAISNLVSNTGVVASNTPGVGAARRAGIGVGYGGDKAIFAYGAANPAAYINVQSLVSNTGVIGADTTVAAGNLRSFGAATSYGSDKAIAGYGSSPAGGLRTNFSNLISNTGVVASDTPGVGTARYQNSAVNYGDDKGVFLSGRGQPVTFLAVANLVSNTGVIAGDSGTPTARNLAAAAGYSASA
jgi:hypothetical protein